MLSIFKRCAGDVGTLKTARGLKKIKFLKNLNSTLKGLIIEFSTDLSQKNQIGFTHKSCKTRAGLVWSSDVDLQ